MRSQHLLLIAALLAIPSLASSQDLAIVDSAINPMNGRSYLLLEPSAWSTARDEAVLFGGNLVTVNDVLEEQWIVANFGSSGSGQRNIWLGLNDEIVEGTFEWVSGEPVTYTNWAPGEPNDAGGIEEYAHIWTATFPQWNDNTDAGGAGQNIHGLVELDACAVPAPDGLTCASTGGDITLGFTNNGPYPGGVEVLRDGEVVDTLLPDATSYVDPDLCLGTYTYIIRGVDAAGCSGYSGSCRVVHGQTVWTVPAPPIPIPDSDPIGIFAVIDFVDFIPITDLDVEVHITHSWLRDLDVAVTSPAATTVTLKEFTAGQTTDVDDIHAIFDSSGIPYDEEQLPAGIHIQPEGPGAMTDFDGENTQGVWALTVIDLVPPDLGTLDGWSVIHVNAPCTVTEPAGVTCEVVGDDVQLNWDNGGNVYTQVEIDRDGQLLAVLPGSPTSYLDVGPAMGVHVYVIRGVDGTSVPCCEAASDPCVAAPGVTDLVWAHPDQDGGATDDEAATVQALADNGKSPATVDELPLDLAPFERVWVVLGTYANNHVLTPAEGQVLRDYCVENDGRLYVSGSDPWGFDAQTPLDDVDGIDALSSVDGSSDLFILNGLDSGQGLSLDDFVGVPYTGENDWIDHLALDDAGLIWQNADNGDPVGTYHDAAVSGTATVGSYRVICTSWEFGGFGGDQEELMARYLDAFDGTAPPPGFIRADADGNGSFNGLVDGLFVLNFQFVVGSPVPPCLSAADADDSGTFSGLVDGLHILSFGFIVGSPPPPPPYPMCGDDPTPDALGCDVPLCP